MPAAARGPSFDRAVTAGGYAWWYCDVVSDDGTCDLTAIAFIGSVFSPSYRAARMVDEGADPFLHCAVNIALHTPDETAWVMAERGPATLKRDSRSWQLGGTRWSWNGDGLHIEFDEPTKPFFQRMRRTLRGSVTLRPGLAWGEEVPIAPGGAHVWRPVAPDSRAEVHIVDGPTFSGPAYCDENAGIEGLERGFRSWNWSRNQRSDGTAVLYDVVTRDGERLRSASLFGRDGIARPFEAPIDVELGSAGWLVPRASRAAADETLKPQRCMVAAPFYARSMLRSTRGDEVSWAIHETLNIERFEAPWVRFLLPWRIRKEQA